MIKSANAFIVVTVMLFSACTGNSGKGKTTELGKDSFSTQHNTTVVQQNEAINSESGLQINNASLGDLLIAGRWLKVPYSDLTVAMKKEMPVILDMINSQKKTMTGPVYAVLNKLPETPEQAIEIFIGIPLNDLKGIKTENTYTVKKKTYYKMEANASPGEALKSHREMAESLKKNKLEFEYPVLETYRETQNSEMVQVLSKTILYYPKK